MSPSPLSPEQEDAAVVSVAPVKRRQDFVETNADERSSPEKSSDDRTVRFAASPEIVEYVVPHHELAPDEKTAIWWSSDDYDEFKITARHICRESRQRQDKFVRVLDNSYKRTRQVFASATNKTTTATSLQQVPADTGLIHWCTHGHSRRGLERWISRLHGEVRSRIASKGVKEVVKHSTVLSRQELRSFSEQQSLVARAFARVMGEADSAAVRSPPKWNGMEYLKQRHQLALMRCQKAAAAKQTRVSLEPSLSFRGIAAGTAT